MTDSKADASERTDHGESTHKRLTRNLNELLQELRVTQTGAQILTGFLLTLPFSTKFDDLNDTQRDVYLVVFAGSVITTGLIVSPVAIHRMLFRQGQRPFLVAAANHLARAGLLTLAVTISGVVWLIFDVVVGSTVALTAGVLSLVFFALMWVVVPLSGRAR